MNVHIVIIEIKLLKVKALTFIQVITILLFPLPSVFLVQIQFIPSFLIS